MEGLWDFITPGLFQIWIGRAKVQRLGNSEGARDLPCNRLSSGHVIAKEGKPWSSPCQVEWYE
jgi:hypothetical protein